MGRLSGKVAIVTGASKGMGRHFVTALLAEGVRVAAIARDSPELASLRDEHGEMVLPIPCDLASKESVDHAVARTSAEFSRLDIVVNNAAYYQPSLFEKCSDDLIHDHVNVNLLGVVWMTRAVIPHLRASQGQIVNISSETVVTPFPMLALYAATKAAVETLSEALRQELRRDGIRIAVLRSGNVAGSAASASWPADVRDTFYRTIVESGHAAISGSPAPPEAMAQALVSLLGFPEEVCPELVQLRGSRPGMPAGAAARAGLGG